MRVLFLNHKRSRCGVYWYGYRLCNIWKKSNEHTITYNEISSLYEHNNINFMDYDVVIYNYHCMTMSWLSFSKNHKKIKTICIWHEGPIHINFTIKLDVSSEIPRPIFEEIPTELENTSSSIQEFINYSEGDVPIIGSFGFGFNSKGFERIITNVCNTFEKAIIKLVITVSEFGDIDGSIVKKINEKCHNLVSNKNIQLKITNEFLTDNDILYFLSKNTINVFLYKEEKGRGLSSVIDFAFSVDRPVCISDSVMFRHIYSDYISIEKKSIKECILNELDFIYKFKEVNSHKNSIKFINDKIKDI